MKYKYWLGTRLVCEAASKVTFTKDFPAIREELVEDVVVKHTTNKRTKTEEAVEENKEN